MIHNFSKGLNTDVQVSLQPEGTYRFALNFVHNTTEGEQGAISNEPGTIVYCTLPEGFKIIGKTVLNDDIILFLVNSGICIIGTIDTRLAAPTFTKVYDGLINTDINNFNFNINYPIDAQARIDFRGHRIVYWTDNNNKRRFADLELTAAEIVALNPISVATALQTEYYFPSIDLTSVNDTGGNLLTGTYQFGVRLLTSSFNATPIGPLSNHIPVAKGNQSDGRNKYDGDYDKVTSKSITLSITCPEFYENIYPYLEVIVVKYGYPSNVLIIEVVKRLDNTGATIPITYTGSELVLEQLPIEAVTVKPAIYDKAKAVEQLQGRLFWSNLGSITDTLPFQQIANLIKVRYIESLSSSFTNFDDYKNPIESYSYRSYQRDEVYSFAIVFIYKDGRESLAYHIPAETGYAAATLSGSEWIPKTYSSTETYPANQDYPSGAIRHHKTPTLAQSPHYKLDGGILKPNVLGVKIKGIHTAINTIDPTILNQIQGYYIVRQDRELAGNKSIIAQGVVNTNLELQYGGADTPFVIKSPLLIETTLDSTIAGNDYEYYWDYEGCPDPGTVGGVNIPMRATDTGNRVEYYNFYSPEITIKGSNITTASKFKYVGLQHISGLQLVDYEQSDIISAAQPNIGYKRAFYLFEPLNTALLTGINLGGSLTYGSNYDISSIITTSPIDEKAPSVSTSAALGSNYLVEYSNIENTILKLNNATLSSSYDVAGSAVVNLFSITNAGAVHSNSSSFYTPLINITNELLNQYGNIANQPFILVNKFSSLSNISASNGNDITCFGGDTFIVKYAFKSCIATPQRGVDAGNYYPETNQEVKEQAGGLIRYISEIIIESTINTNYRHQFSQDLNGDGDTSDTGETGVPYYPNSSASDVLTANPAFGESKSYNSQYSLQNSLNSYVSKPIGFQVVSNYPNRTIYSEQMLEGEQLDAYREYRPLNFQDTPKHKGEIWDNFVYNNTLYLHTPRTLFKTFVNPIAQQPNDIGSIILGSGGVFQLPPQELFTISGGYAGSISQFAGQLTPFGYIFPDVLQGKLFIFGEGIAEVNEGLTRYFQNNFKLISSESSYNDNPFNSKGVLSGYDYDFQRYLITYFDKNGNSATLSYYPKLKLWSSFHSYKPNYYISADNKFFSGNTNLHKHNEGNFGNYYGVEYDSSLQLITNEAVLATKVFDNQIVNMQNRNSNSIIVDRAGDTAYWETETDSTAFDIAGVKTPNNLLYNQTFVPTHTDNEVLMSYDNKEYRLAIPRNNVINYQGGLGVNNLDTLITGKAARLFNLRNRLKGKYLISNFTFNNSQNYKLIINYIQSIFRKNER